MEVKRPEGRKKRSGVCIGIWLAVGALCAIILILMAYMAANYLENQSRGLLHKLRLTKNESAYETLREFEIVFGSLRGQTVQFVNRKRIP